MDKQHEVKLDEFDFADDRFTGQLADAIDGASDQDQTAWLTSNGKRVAAIVPVDVAERWLMSLAPRRPWVRGYDDGFAGMPEDPGELVSFAVLKYRAGYAIGKLDRAS